MNILLSGLLSNVLIASSRRLGLALLLTLAWVNEATAEINFGDPKTYSVADVATAIAHGDFDRDGRLDLAVATASGDVAILRGNGDGSFNAAIKYGVGGWSTAVAPADFDGDGRLDLAVATYEQIGILLGNGDGSFKAPVRYGSGGVHLALGDFNGDGHVDLVVLESTTISLLLGNGDGSFKSPLSFLASGYPASVAVGDFDRDGRLDLAVAQGFVGDRSIDILLGNGDGSFRPHVGYRMGVETNIVAAVDLNGDGLSDLAVEDSYEDVVFILLGKGDGSFQAPASYPAQGRFVAPGEFDHDGRMDLVIGSSALRGKGDGSFEPFVRYTDYAPVSLAPGDFNGDGWLDVAFANHTGFNNDVVIHLNTQNVQAQAPLTAVASPASIPFNGTSTLSTTGGSGTGAVTYAVTDGKDFCSVTGSTLTGTGVGTCTVTATKAGDTNYRAAKATIEVTVKFTQGASVILPSPVGGGDVTVKLQATTGGSLCEVTLYPMSLAPVAPPVAPPAGVSFPHGLLDGLRLENCTPGASATLRVTYPSALPAGAEYWLYGPTPDNRTAHWYAMPAGSYTIAGNVVTHTITDGALGDFDLTTDGVIVDVGGPAAINAPLTVVASPASIAYQGTATLITTGGFGTGAVTYAVTAGSSFCSVAGNTLTGTGVGTCTVTATKAADATYGASTATVDLLVTHGPSVTLPSPVGDGKITVALQTTTGGALCQVTLYNMSPAPVAPPLAPPAGLSFPHGVLDGLKIEGCTPGASATLRITYPSALPTGTQYWMYGPTPDDDSAHWYAMPAGSYTVAGNVVTHTLTDGALGDFDLTANGIFIDVGGPAVAAAAPVPVLAPLALGTLAVALVGIGAGRLRRRAA